MNYVTKIRMKYGCASSSKLTEIEQLYISGKHFEGWYTTQEIYDYLLDSPGTIFVNIEPYPELLPAVNASGEKYVKSDQNRSRPDQLLSLPRGGWL